MSKFAARRIADILKDGITFDLKNWRDGKMDVESLSQLPQSVDNLFSALDSRRIDYLLVGGLALLSYIEGRNTQDVDFILSKRDLETLPELVITEENQSFARGMFETVQVDLLLTQNRLFEQVQRDYATTQQYGGRAIKCVTVEGLVILKLYVLPSLYSQGLFSKVSIYENDVQLLLLSHEVDLPPLLRVIAPHVIASDLSAIEETVADIRARLVRFTQRRDDLT